MTIFVFADNIHQGLPAESLPSSQLNLGLTFVTAPAPLTCVASADEVEPIEAVPTASTQNTGMEDKDDNVPLRFEGAREDDEPLFPGECRILDTAANQQHDTEDANLLLALAATSGEASASNGLKRVHELFQQLSDAEKLLFFRQEFGNTKKAKKSETKPKNTVTPPITVEDAPKRQRQRPYPYPHDIRIRTLEFIEGHRRSAQCTSYEAKNYMVALLKAWATWPGSHPAPRNSQVLRWIRDARKNAVFIRTRATALKKWQTEFESRVPTIGLCEKKGPAAPWVSALSCLVCGITAQLHSQHHHETILLLAQVNKNTLNQLSQLSEYETARALAITRRPDLDTQLLIQQYAQSKIRDTSSGAAEKRDDTVQVEIDFSMQPNLKKFQEGQLTADHRLSLQNILRNPSPFLDGEANRVSYIGNGTFGIVLGLGLPKDGVALKISKNLQNMDTIPAVACNEMAMHIINEKLNSTSSRGTLRTKLPRPFGPLPVSETRQCGSWKNKICCAMPSALSPGMGYAVIVTRLAYGNLDRETEEISKNCFSNTYVENDGLVRAASLIKGILTAVNSLHAVGSAHRDIKASNTLYYDARRGHAQHIHRLVNGKFVLIALTDFGKSIPFGTKVLPGTGTSAARPNAASSRSKAILAAETKGVGYEAARNMAAERGKEIAKNMKELQHRPAENVWEISQQYNPVSIGREDGLHEIQAHSIHVLTGCFPSSLPVNEKAYRRPPPPIQKQLDGEPRPFPHLNLIRHFVKGWIILRPSIFKVGICLLWVSGLLRCW